MKIYLLTLLSVFASTAGADFGEIDILVKESIAAHFREYGKEVDLERLEYADRPTITKESVIVESSVWAEQNLIAPYWGWHNCTTTLKIVGRGRYEDQGSDCQFQFDPSVPQTAAAGEVMTLKKWKSLSEDDKDLLLEGIKLERYFNLKFVEISERDAISKVKPGLVATFAKSMEAFMRENSNLETEDEHSRIGSPYVHWVNVLYIDGQVLGGSIGFIQDGCDMKKDNWQYFETREEAKAGGCDVDADVSWQAHGTFDYDGKAIRYDEYLEWSGY